MRVDIKNIAVGNRIRKEISKIGELAADIAQNGLLNAITVMEIGAGGGEYQLLAGVRRLKAAQSLGWTDIPVNVVKPADAERELRIEISENEQREEFTFSEKMEFAQLLSNIESAKALERKLAGKKINGDLRFPGTQGSSDNEDRFPGTHLKTGRTREIVGEQIGMKGSTFDRAKYIMNNAPQDVIDELDKGERAIHTTYKEIRAMKKAEEEPETESEKAVPPVKPASDKPKTPKPKPPKTPYMERLSAQEDERIRKIKEFEALPPEGKIAELERRLDEEKIRANNAVHALEDFKYKTHNDIYHRDCMIENLTNRNKELEAALNAANARIAELLGAKEDAL